MLTSIHRKEVITVEVAVKNVVGELMETLLNQRLTMLRVGIEMLDGMLQVAYKSDTKDRRKDALTYLPTLIELKKNAVIQAELIEDTLEEKDYKQMSKVWISSREISTRVLAISNDVLNK